MTTPLTDADLDQLDALAEAATPGPWHYNPNGKGVEGDGWVRASDRGHEFDVVTETYWRKEDAAFIAAARLAIPALVAEVRRLRGVASAAVATPALGARLRDMTVAQLDALPVGSVFVDENDIDPDSDSDPVACAFTKDDSGTWSAPALSRRTSVELIAAWGTARGDYRLAHLPESP